jgi:hypothetical protein
MSQEERIRELCIQLVNAHDHDREDAIGELKLAIRRYLEAQSDQQLKVNVRKMPEPATATTIRTNRKRAA